MGRECHRFNSRSLVGVASESFKRVHGFLAFDSPVSSWLEIKIAMIFINELSGSVTH